MVHIEEILQPSRILFELAASSKSDGLRLMVDRLVALDKASDAPKVHRLLLDREKLMTTGVKRGFAFPHAFSEQFEGSFLTIGVFPAGLEFEALDKRPVEFVFLLLGPPHHQAVHLQILARVSRLTGQPEMYEALRAAQSSAEIMDRLIETERRLTAYPYKTASAE